MNINFCGKRALITCVGRGDLFRGIGKMVSTTLADLGAQVAAVTSLKDFDYVSKLHPNIKPLCLDVGDWETTKRALEKLKDIDLLVNNASFPSCIRKNIFSEAEVDRVYSVNFKSFLNISMTIAEQMKENGKLGSIVNVSSFGSMIGLPETLISTSKAAVDQLTKCMTSEFGPNQIRVNSVTPIAISCAEGDYGFDPHSERADFFLSRLPLRRFGDLHEAVNPIVFLLSDKASMITGINLPIDAGATNSFS